MKKHLFAALIAMALLLSLLSPAYAQSYTVLIGDIPGIDSLVEMTRTLGEEMGAKFDIQKVPMPRMISMIAANQADFAAPLLQVKDPAAAKNLPYAQSTGVIQQMCFILYTNKSKPIDIANLKNGNSKGYRIESDISNAQMFSFKTLQSTNPLGSFKKVNDGQIDGYILGSEPGDSILMGNKAAMGNVKRELWDTYDIGYALAKNDKTAAMDKLLNEGIKKLKASGKLDKIMADVAKSGTYNNWQP